MKNDKIKAVVVVGWLDERGVSQMISMLGAYENLSEAYGEAYLYFDEISSSYDEEEGIHITTLFRLEGDSGYAMYLQDKNGKDKDYAYILTNFSYKEQEEQDAGDT